MTFKKGDRVWLVRWLPGTYFSISEYKYEGPPLGDLKYHYLKQVKLWAAAPKSEREGLMFLPGKSASLEENKMLSDKAFWDLVNKSGHEMIKGIL